jgi:hypothetical protein
VASSGIAQLDVVVEHRQEPNAARDSRRVLAVARVASASLNGAVRRVLTLVPEGAAAEIRADAASCVAIDDGLTAEQALQIPALVWSLWAWDQLHLELGEAALYCVGSPFPHFLGQTAVMHGALPVIQLGAQGSAAGVEALPVDDAGLLLSELRKRLKKSVGVAAIDLSGKADIADVLFEGLPRSSRLMLAAHRGSPLTIDFYNNVHRKGVLLRTCVSDPLQVIDSAFLVTNRAYVVRANRLLARRSELFLPADGRVVS